MGGARACFWGYSWGRDALTGLVRYCTSGVMCFGDESLKRPVGDVGVFGRTVVRKSIWTMATIGVMGLGTAAAATSGLRVEQQAAATAAERARVVALHRQVREMKRMHEVCEERTIATLPAPVVAPARKVPVVKGNAVEASRKTTELSRV